MAARRPIRPKPKDKPAVTGIALIRRLQRQASATVSDVLDVMGLTRSEEVV